MNLIINNPDYVNNIKKIKRIGLNPGGIEKACDWVEYAVENGYEHLVDKNMHKIAERDPLKVIWGTVVGVLVAGLAYVGYKYGLPWI